MGRKRNGEFSVDDAPPPNFSERRWFLKLLVSIIFYPVALEKTVAIESSDYSVYWLKLGDGAVNSSGGTSIAEGKPGSLMKLVAAAALIEENLPASRKIVDCRGAIVVNGKRYCCLHPHGRVSLTTAIGQSCNVFFARAARELHLSTFMHYLEMFGIRPLESRKPGSRRSASASVEYVLGLANGFELTSLQIIQLVALIATRGKMPPVHLAQQEGRQGISQAVHFADHTWNVLQEGMKLAGRSGTAKNLDPGNKLHLAVKTGTTIHGQKFQSWVAGYFPYESPRYVFCLRANVGTSYDQAIPLARGFLFAKTWP
jgi:cell division protein FtsI/penicillin-binding protein 2